MCSILVSQAELDRLKGKDAGEAVLTETDEDKVQRLQQEAAVHPRAVKEHRKALRRLQHAARNPDLTKPGSASDEASGATLSRKTQDLVQGVCADTNQDGSLDRNKWAQACESVLGHAAPDPAKALFDKMDFDKSGNMSMGHFVEIRRAVRLFVTQSGFQELVVESLSGLMYGRRR